MRTSRILSRPIAVLASLVVFSLAAPVTLAMPVFFDFSGTCSNNCVTLLGVADGTAVSGFIETDDSAFGDNVVDGTEVSDFEFVLGAVTLNPTAFSFNSSLVLNAAMDGFDAGTFSVLNLGPFSIFLELAAFDTWIYTEGGGISANGPGTFARRAVPEPTTALLLGIGLIGFAATRRLRR